ncbi:alpha/beta hydrolase [Mycobacterium sp. NPDC050551]|uniref:alpha/beta hydrolase n=1 Tax=Mycobacterium sp. NPDC050551 TaxID=3155407 RepID=UPI003422F253
MVEGLEVIDKGGCTSGHPAPLLFVHGSWHAAWCWDEHFLDFFAERGYRTLAVSLRGHGGSRTHPRPRSCALAHFVEDVAAVADELGSEPVLIGHSLGGAVVQKYLETHHAQAGVLVASMPVSGIVGYMGRLWRHHPVQAAGVTLRGRQSVGTATRAREMFFSASLPEADVARYAARLGEELVGRLTLDTLGWDKCRPERVTAPMLVLGGENDRCFTVAEVESTARAYGTEAEIFPGMAHNMMLEPGWADVAERIDGWLGERGL